MRYFTKVILLTMRKIDIKEQKGKIKQLSCLKCEQLEMSNMTGAQEKIWKKKSIGRIGKKVPKLCLRGDIVSCLQV